MHLFNIVLWAQLVDTKMMRNQNQLCEFWCQVAYISPHIGPKVLLLAAGGLVLRDLYSSR